MKNWHLKNLNGHNEKSIPYRAFTRRARHQSSSARARTNLDTLRAIKFMNRLAKGVQGTLVPLFYSV